MAELEKVLQELRGKNLLTDEDERRLNLPDKEDPRPILVGFLDGLVSANKITREQADRYILRIGLDPEKIQRMRENWQKETVRRKKLN